MIQIKKIAVGFLLATLWVGAAEADTIYKEDLARQLASPKEIRKVSNIRASLRREAKEASPLFVLTPPPFQDIQAAPNEMSRIPDQPRSWEVPPFATLDPALPADLPEEARRLIEKRRGADAQAETWPELITAGGSDSHFSALLRPKAAPVSRQFMYNDREIPEPFSLRRYYDNENIFVEIAAYGGTTSFRAESAYRALKEAATKQQALQGFGEEAFLTRVEILEETAEEPQALPFAELEVKGEERPDLMDSGRATAMMAPAFQGVAVKDLEGRTIHYSEPNKKYRSSSPEVKQSVLVIVAFFPDKAITVSMALEERLGSVADLVAVAMMVQRKVRDELKRS